MTEHENERRFRERNDYEFLQKLARNGSREESLKLHGLLSKVYWRQPVEDLDDQIGKLTAWRDSLPTPERDKISALTAAASSLNQLVCGNHPHDVFGSDVTHGLPLMFQAYGMVGDAYEDLTRALRIPSSKRYDF